VRGARLLEGGATTFIAKGRSGSVRRHSELGSASSSGCGSGWRTGP